MNKDNFLIDESEVHYESLRLAFTQYDLSYVADWRINERIYDYIRSKERKAYTELANVIDANVQKQIDYYNDLNQVHLEKCFELADGDESTIDWILDVQQKMMEYYG